MTLRAFRWAAVPMTALAGVAVIGILFYEITDVCINFCGPDRCRGWLGLDWFTINTAVCGVSVYLCSVLLPSLIAPSHKKTTEFLALALVLIATFVVAAFFAFGDRAMFAVFAAVIVAAAALSGVLRRYWNRRRNVA